MWIGPKTDRECIPKTLPKNSQKLKKKNSQKFIQLEVWAPKELLISLKWIPVFPTSYNEFI